MTSNETQIGKFVESNAADGTSTDTTPSLCRGGQRFKRYALAVFSIVLIGVGLGVATVFIVGVDEFKDKWMKIGSMCRRKHRLSQQQSGSGATSKPDHPRYFKDVLHYILPIFFSFSTRSPNDSEHSGVTITENDTEAPDEEVAESTSTSQENTNSSIETFKRNEAQKRKYNDALDEAMIDYFNAKAIANRGKNSVEDNSTSQSDERFLLSLKEDLKEMNPIQKRQFKKRIYDLIEDIVTASPRASVVPYRQPYAHESTTPHSSFNAFGYQHPFNIPQNEYEYHMFFNTYKE